MSTIASAADGWLACDDLLAVDGAELDRWLASIAARYQAPPETAACYLLGWYTYGLAACPVTLLIMERRVPDLRPCNVSIHRTDGLWVDRTKLHSPAVTVLPGDPAIGTPGVVTVEDLPALRCQLAVGLLAHLTPLVDALRPRARLGLRVRWGLVADSLAAAFLAAGRAIGDQPRARREADALFDAAGDTLRSRPAWVPVEHGGQCHLFLRRAACCLAYKTPGSCHCTSCPAVSDTDRQHRLRAYLEGE